MGQVAYPVPAAAEAGTVQPPDGSYLRPWWLGLQANATIVEQTIYSVYLGYTLEEITVTDVEMYVVVAGGGTQAGEVGLASSPVAPNGAAQVLTKIVATGSLDALNATGSKGAASSLNQVVAAGVHLWAVVRTQMSSTEPACLFLVGDMQKGYVLVTTGQAAITGLASWTGTLAGHVTNSVSGPLLVATYT